MSRPDMSGDAGTSRPMLAEDSTYQSAPSAYPAAGNGAKERKKVPSEFPVRLYLNITPAMAASLQRLHRRLRLKEAVIGRLALMTYLAQNDREYRED
jgi:hypothetical protein